MDGQPIEPEQVVRNVIEALNRGDIEAALSCCADDIMLWAPGRDLRGQKIVGKEQLRLVLEYSEARWPDMWTAVQSVVTGGDLVAVEMIAVATEGGRRIAQPMAAFYTVRDGLIVEQRSYYDLGALERSLSR